MKAERLNAHESVCRHGGVSRERNRIPPDRIAFDAAWRIPGLAPGGRRCRKHTFAVTIRDACKTARGRPEDRARKLGGDANRHPRGSALRAKKFQRTGGDRFHEWTEIPSSKSCRE